MIQNKISNIIDGILLFLVTTFFGIAVVGYFSSSSTIIILSGIAIGLCTTKIVIFYNEKKKPYIDKKSYELMLNEFYLGGKEFSKNYIYQALKLRYNTTLCDSYIMIDNNIAVFVELVPKKLSFFSFCKMYSITDDNIKKNRYNNFSTARQRYKAIGICNTK